MKSGLEEGRPGERVLSQSWHLVTRAVLVGWDESGK